MAENDFIPTRGSAAIKSKIDFKPIAFSTRKSESSKRSLEKLESLEDKYTNEINMKRARFEIIKFGMSGFDSQKKEEAKVQLAIKLGAKPRRNAYKNYKLLQQERKQEIEKEKSKLEFQQLGKNKMGKSNAKGKNYDRKRKKGNNILAIYGNVKASQMTDPKRENR